MKKFEKTNGKAAVTSPDAIVAALGMLGISHTIHGVAPTKTKVGYKAQINRQLQHLPVSRFKSTNRKYAAESDHFRKLCEDAGVQPTKRQASKFRNERGSAFRMHKGKLAAKYLDLPTKGEKAAEESEVVA